MFDYLVYDNLNSARPIAGFLELSDASYFVEKALETNPFFDYRLVRVFEQSIINEKSLQKGGVQK